VLDTQSDCLRKSKKYSRFRCISQWYPPLSKPLTNVLKARFVSAY